MNGYGYPLVMTNIAIDSMVIEIVDFPINSMVDLSSSLCNSLPEGIPNLYQMSITYLTHAEKKTTTFFGFTRVWLLRNVLIFVAQQQPLQEQLVAGKVQDLPFSRRLVTGKWHSVLQVTLWLCQNSYWKWPSRNSEFSHEKWWIFPSFFVNVYQAGYLLNHPADHPRSREFISWLQGH